MLVVGADERFALPMSVTIQSALVNLPEDTHVRIHVLDGGMSEASRQRVQRVAHHARSTVELMWHLLDPDRLADLRVVGRMSTAAYLRLLIPELLADERKIVYLDSDVLVRNDLSLLVEEAARSDFPVHAVSDFRHADFGDVLGDEACAVLALDKSAEYFNSGVLVIDVGAWRDLGIAEQAFAFVREHRSLMRYHDQDALNYVLVDRWGKLDPRWNVMLAHVRTFVAGGAAPPSHRMGVESDLVTDGFILHFVGPNKPWEGRYTGTAQSEYVKALIDSAWFRHKGERLWWRLKLAAATAAWKVYRRLPLGFRTRVRTTLG